MDSESIERIAINTIEREALKYRKYIKTYIDKNDKTPFWDGSIYVLNGKDSSKNSFEYKIDVQVKGKEVEKFSENSFNYQFDIVYLKGYLKDEKGTILFVVEEIDSENTKIFYKVLLPLDLNEILSKVDEEQKTVSIKVKMLNKTISNNLQNVCLLFMNNSKRQLRANIIDESEFKDIKKITIPIIPNDNNIDFLKYSKELDDTYVYATLSNGSERILHKGDLILSELNQPNIIISSPIKVFYNQIKTVINDKEKVIFFGKSIKADLTNNLLEYDFKGSLDEVLNDTEFLIYLSEEKEIYINGKKKKLPVPKTAENNKFLKDLKDKEKILVEFSRLLEKYNLKFEKNIEQLSPENIHEIRYFIEFNNKNIRKFDIGIKFVKFKFLEYFLKLVIVNKENEYKVYDFYDEFSKQVETYIDDNEKKYIVSPYLYSKVSEISKISNIRTNVIKESICSITDNNEFINNLIRLYVLELLKSFDLDNSRTDLLELANDLNEFISIRDSLEEINYINKAQILKRMNQNYKIDYEKLYEYKKNCNDINLKACIDILLENKYEVKKALEDMTDEEKVNFMEFPIYNLYNNN